MSGSGTCVEPNKPPSIDTATCIPQANELLRLASVLTLRGSDYSVKESQDTCSNTHTHTHALMPPPSLRSYCDNRKARVTYGVDCYFSTS